jgi:hypothetical protein
VELERCIRWLAPASLLVLAAAAYPTAPPGVRAAAPAGVAATSCTRVAGTLRTTADRSSVAWYRLDPVLDRAGTLVGQRLSAGSGDGAGWIADLPAESFASGPVNGVVLVGDDDGRRSRLRLLDAPSGCWADLAEEEAVIRSAVLSADGTTAWEHRVDRATRADLGVWRRTVGDGPASGARKVLPGLAPDAGHGSTFATDLSMAAGGELVVASCGERACRTRVLDPDTGTIRTAGGTGPVVGLAARELVALAPCLALPCPVVGIDLDTGAARTIAITSGPATLAGAGGSLLVVAASGGGVAVVDVEEPDLRPDLVPGSTGMIPVRRGSTATSGLEAGPRSVAVAPDGVVTGPGSAHLLDPVTRTLARSTEVLP